MAGGTEFETENIDDGIKFIVTVPDGGVTKGSTFTVPYPSTSSKSSSTSKSKTSNNNIDNGAMDPSTIASTDIQISSSTEELTEELPIDSANGAVAELATVQVMAPSTMNVSQMFEAQVDGIKFMVTVPQNGINQCELFTVPYPTTTATIGPMATAGGNYNDRVMDNVANAHNGTWRTDLFDGFYSNINSCFCLCFMGFCCTHILMAKLMQRMKYNLGGVPVHVNNDGNTRRPICGYEYVCIVISIATICIYIALYVLAYYEINIGYILLLLSGWRVYLIIISTCTRYSMRKKYNIKSLCLCCNGNGYGNENENDNCCDGIEDCCTVSWCSCCSAVQMISHTHDGRKYPYQGCNQTGIDMYAPDCVVGVV